MLYFDIIYYINFIIEYKFKSWIKDFFLYHEKFFLYLRWEMKYSKTIKFNLC